MSTPIIIPGDCLAMLPLLPPASVDAVITDPPYGLGFMGKAWDDLPPGREWAEACLRVLKPGGHLLAFGGARTWHRLVVAIEDAGFEIRDSIAWLYGSGFPKSLDVSKAIDKAAGAEREVVGRKGGRYATPKQDFRGGAHHSGADTSKTAIFDAITAPATDDAQQWAGWGTALKPAFEPIVVARKPLIGTVAANVLAHGTGALNIDACRIGNEARPVMVRTATTVAASSMSGESTGATASGETTTAGRWPANVVLDESQAATLDEQSGYQKDGVAGGNRGFQTEYVGGQHKNTGLPRMGYGGGGGASRFFYVAKAPTKERPKIEDQPGHPTVKPLTLMRWLVRLVTPPSGTVLDPFLGSGTTAEACLLEGFLCIGIEREPHYVELARVRLAKHEEETA